MANSFTWNFKRSPLGELRGEMPSPRELYDKIIVLNNDSDFADVVKYFDNDFDKAEAWWMDHHPEDYNSVRGQQQGTNFVGNSRAAMNMNSPAAIEARNIAHSTIADYPDGVRGQRQGSNFVGNSRAAMNMNSPAAIEARNIAKSTANIDAQNERIAQFAKAAEIEDRARTRNSEIQAIQNKIGENNIQIDKLERTIESIKIKYAKKADYEMTDDTVNENIAMADMLKIGEPGTIRDNTSFWRWREQQNDAKAARAEQRALVEAEKDRLNEKAISDFNNKMTNFLTNPTDFDSTTAQNQYISNLNTLITEGQNLGADVSPLIEMRKTLIGEYEPEADPAEAAPDEGTPADGNTVTLESLKSMKNDIEVQTAVIQGYDYRNAKKVRNFNKKIDEFNKARAAAIKQGIIKEKDMDLMKQVPVPLAPPPQQRQGKTDTERAQDAADAADTAVTQALAAKNASNLKKLITNARLTTKQKNTLADWIKSQTSITSTSLQNKITEIINGGN